ncbi:MAG: FtsQ-type POTRA domain-containing protein [Deltaproteobacteria bacterium]|nr:MAG: FtsQ-type POTRA domain-containing protein [Deltaproteobacteria bacterium]
MATSLPSMARAGTRRRPVRKNRPDRVNRKRSTPRFTGDAFIEEVYGTLSIFLLFFLLLVAARFLPEALASLPLFPLREIVVEGGDRFDEARILTLSDLCLGNSLLSVDPIRIEDQLSRNPWIRKAKVDRIWPNRIAVRLEERRAVAAIDSGKELALLDERGTIFLHLPDRTAFPTLPRIVGAVAGLEREAHFMSKIAGLVLRLHDSPTLDGHRYALHLDRDRSLTILDPVEEREIHLGRGAYERKIEKFENLWPKIEAEEPDFEFIDLSFGPRVVVRRKGAG